MKDFEDLSYCVEGSITVAPQEDDDEADTGLVVLKLAHAPGSIYFQPASWDNPQWLATINNHSEEVALDPHKLAAYAAEMAVAGNLCTYLQWRSLEWDRESGAHPQAAPGTPSA